MSFIAVFFHSCLVWYILSPCQHDNSNITVGHRFKSTPTNGPRFSATDLPKSLVVIHPNTSHGRRTITSVNVPLSSLGRHHKPLFLQVVIFVADVLKNLNTMFCYVYFRNVIFVADALKNVNNLAGVLAHGAVRPHLQKQRSLPPKVRLWVLVWCGYVDNDDV